MALRKPEKLGVSNAAEPLEATAARRYTPPKFSDRLPYALAASATVLTSFLWFELPFKVDDMGEAMFVAWAVMAAFMFVVLLPGMFIDEDTVIDHGDK